MSYGVVVVVVVYYRTDGTNSTLSRRELTCFSSSAEKFQVLLKLVYIVIYEHILTEEHNNSIHQLTYLNKYFVRSSCCLFF